LASEHVELYRATIGAVAPGEDADRIAGRPSVPAGSRAPSLRA
jgi:hypothetical protein